MVSPTSTDSSVCVYCGRMVIMLVQRPGVWVEWSAPEAPNAEHCYSYIDLDDGMKHKEREHFARADLPASKAPEYLERWLKS